MKLAIERVVAIRCHLRSMGVNVGNPEIIHCDNKDVITNITASGSILSKKHLALACHFCREHFSAEVVDIRWSEGKHDMTDAMTKALTAREFHGHLNKAIKNS